MSENEYGIYINEYDYFRVGFGLLDDDDYGYDDMNDYGYDDDDNDSIGEYPYYDKCICGCRNCSIICPHLNILFKENNKVKIGTTIGGYNTYHLIQEKTPIIFTDVYEMVLYFDTLIPGGLSYKKCFDNIRSEIRHWLDCSKIKVIWDTYTIVYDNTSIQNDTVSRHRGNMINYELEKRGLEDIWNISYDSE